MLDKVVGVLRALLAVNGNLGISGKILYAGGYAVEMILPQYCEMFLLRHPEIHLNGTLRIFLKGKQLAGIGKQTRQRCGLQVSRGPATQMKLIYLPVGEISFATSSIS